MSQGIQKVTNVPSLGPRRAEAHKGDFGRVLVVGGSRGMIGAPALAANAALRGGAGLVTVAAPETVQLTVAALCPCATSIPLACEADGRLSSSAADQIARAAESADVLAVGPGLGTGEAQQAVVRAAATQGKPCVLDADGLNSLDTAWASARRAPMVLTPHPGEFARLTGRTVAGIQADRQAAAVAAARQWAKAGRAGADLVIVLKGAGTVVTDGRRVYINDTGNPGMATGGSGDVLTGVIAALIAQKMTPFNAALLGTHLHGLAGDLAAAKLTEVCLTAADILDALPEAFRQA